ncbi:MAG: hypothetical protein ACRD3M_14540 [Thermoanaerobaculia bacterium]
MKRHQIPALAFAAVLAASCSSPQSPAPAVPVEAAKADLSALVGKWAGDYSSPDTGRIGSIVFEMKSAGSTAHGDVLMWPKGSQQLLAPSKSGQLSEEQLRTMPQVLSINFVRAEGGQISGTMDPYTDPDCRCDVRTTFTGAIQGDSISGTFSTERWDRPGTLASGVWKVTRQKA